MSGPPAAADFERREVLYSGRVQGVGFRFTTRHIAQRFPVTGFVQNLHDGRVRLVVEGRRSDLDSFLGELASEMERYIDGKQDKIQPASGEFSGFQVRF